MLMAGPHKDSATNVCVCVRACRVMCVDDVLKMQFLFPSSVFIREMLKCVCA